MTTQVLEAKPEAVAADDKPENAGAGNGTALEAGREDAPLQPADNPDEAAKPDATPAETEGQRLEREANEAEIDRRAEEKAAKLVADQNAKNAESARVAAAKTRDAEIATATAGFGPMVAQLEANLIKAGMDEDAAKELLAPLHGHNGKLTPVVKKLYDSATNQVAEDVSEWAKSQAGDNAEIAQMVDDGKPLAEVLTAVVEAKALASDAVRKAKPEDLIAAHKGLDAYVKAEKLASYKEGRKDPYPDGEPESNGASAAQERMTYARLLKLPEAEKQAFIQKNPDKWAEFIGTKT